MESSHLKQAHKCWNNWKHPLLWKYHQLEMSSKFVEPGFDIPAPPFSPKSPPSKRLLLKICMSSPIINAAAALGLSADCNRFCWRKLMHLLAAIGERGKLEEAVSWEAAASLRWWASLDLRGSWQTCWVTQLHPHQAQHHGGTYSYYHSYITL